jgi:hypothetical protein
VGDRVPVSWLMYRRAGRPSWRLWNDTRFWTALTSDLAVPDRLGLRDDHTSPDTTDAARGLAHVWGLAGWAEVKAFWRGSQPRLVAESSEVAVTGSIALRFGRRGATTSPDSATTTPTISRPSPHSPGATVARFEASAKVNAAQPPRLHDSGLTRVRPSCFLCRSWVRVLPSAQNTTRRKCGRMTTPALRKRRSPALARQAIDGNCQTYAAMPAVVTRTA